MKLSEHFTLEELTASEEAKIHRIDNTAPQEIVPRLVLVAQMLEEIRKSLGDAPMTVTSGYRCPELNALVSTAHNSDHIYGRAADFIAPQFGDPYEIARHLQPLVELLGIGQLILEGVKGKKWVHVSTHAPMLAINRVITITDAGPVAGIHELA